MASRKKDNTPPKPGLTQLGPDARALLAASVDAAFVIDTEGTILGANDAAATMVDLAFPSQAEGKNYRSFLPDEIAGQRQAIVNRTIRQNKPVRFEVESNGRSLIYTLTPVINTNGSVIGLAIIIHDATEFRQADQHLRREQQRQIFFMESLPGLVYHLYPDKSIRYANRVFRKYFGSPRGKTCLQALACDEKQCDACPPMNAMEHDRAVEWDWTDNQGRTFHLQCSPMTDNNGERMLMVLGIDITARKSAEDALQRAHDKLEDRVRQRTKELQHANEELTNKSIRLVGAMEKADQAARAKSSFLANMSHEIRTPLNAVLGMSELALRTVDPSRKNTYLRQVLQAGNSLLTVINDILDFSKIEAHKLHLESINFDLARCIGSAMDIHSLQAREKDLTISSSIDPSVPEVLVGDPTRLQQVLNNLLSNAIKFTETGEVRLDVSLAPNQPEDPDGPALVAFSVTDTGIGIPKDKQAEIFRRFLQADDSITRKHGGAGLGLAICKLLVELMHGEMSLVSTEDQGSVFSFTATMGRGSRDAVVDSDTGDATPLNSSLPPLHVLLADDNRQNRTLATILLEEDGHSVIAVTNGRDALNLLKKENFDLVLMDVQMPLMDGISATRAIRDPNSGVLNHKIPIIALTAHALVGDRQRFLDVGMDGYIPKPFRLKDIFNVISQTLGVSKQPPDADQITPPQSKGPFDREAALAMLGGKQDLLRKMDAIFLRDTPLDLQQLRDNLKSGNFSEASRFAHSIKGSARTVGAFRAGAVAEQVEYLCRQKDEKPLASEMIILESEVQNALLHIERASFPTNSPTPN